MRCPDQVEILHLDFDGFFASVAQQADRGGEEPASVVQLLHPDSRLAYVPLTVRVREQAGDGAYEAISAV